MDSEECHGGEPGFFDVDDRLKRLSDLGDQLEAFRTAVDFELFRPELDAALDYGRGARWATAI
jgi:IS5 family transposase